MNISRIMKEISDPVFFVTNDVSKGIGIEGIIPNYHIVCLDDHPLVDYLIEKGIKIFCLERELRKRNQIIRSTSRILDHPLVLDYLGKESQNKTPLIMFFKPSAKIDFVCQKNGFKKIGNSAGLNRLFEDKIIFYEKCLKENISVFPGKIIELKTANFLALKKSYQLPLVFQFGRGWAGSTTFFINSEDEFSNLQNKFSPKKVKVTKFIKGKTVLNNACLFQNKIFIGPPAVQLRATGGFTAAQAGTVGRQWPAQIPDSSVEDIYLITTRVGEIMSQSGYQGYFGLDFIVEEQSGRVFLSENNARLTASVPFYTKLEIQSEQVPLLAFHLLSFLQTSDYGGPAYPTLNLKGSEVVLKNDCNYPLKVQSDIKTGIYQLKNQNSVFLRKDFFADNLKEDEFWLFPAAEERIVNPEIELMRADFKGMSADEQGNILSEIKEILLKIKEDLRLKKCQG